MIEPYYQDDACTIYHGDCREILPQLEHGETIITDPVWPNALPQWKPLKPWTLFADMCSLAAGRFERLVVQLGCDSDPRFLQGVPISFEFLRVCWLDYARPSYKGRLLYTGDVAYAFGIPPDFIKGRQVMSGMCRSSRPDRLFARGTGKKTRAKDFSRDGYDGLLHPSPRRYEHVKWLVHQFSDKHVVDPCAGSFTTAVACKELGRKCIAIEKEEEFCEIGVERLRQEVLPL